MVSEAPEAENIAVCIRVRPLNERELRSEDANVLATVPQMNVVSLTDATGQPLGGKGNVFQYDHIFDAQSDARSIYRQVAGRIVRSTLQGINGTVFAYGQTSSGKTFTMQGEDGALPFEQSSECQPGILQLAIEDIFSYIESCTDRDFLLRVSFLEIYNEVVKDLLNSTETGANLKLREDPRKGVYVECKEEIITNYEDIVSLLQTGNQHRTVGHTAMNERSSRSHSVFRIVIESKQKSDSRRHSEEDVNGAVLVASLNLVDLAGSESLRHTGAEGIRQREAGNINKSLLTLARVINSLASSGGQNAPFRDSKLTRLLQNSLGGNTRTLIICCVTPSDRYLEETKSTLQFAARAKDIQTSATVNEVLDDQTQLRRLKREVHDLKKFVNTEALSALKAENAALLSEKNHNKEEMARLMGLILSSASVAKSAADKKQKLHGKRMRETWGPGDFPANLKSLIAHQYPRKRHSASKENEDPQILFRVHEDIPALQDVENPAFSPATGSCKAKKADQENKENKENSKKVLDLFSAALRSYRDSESEEQVDRVEALANEKCASLDDIERARVLELLREIKSLVASKQSKSALEEKQAGKNREERLAATCDCSNNSSTTGTLVEEVMAELVSTQKKLTLEKTRSEALEIEKENSQQMAAEEMDALRNQLNALRLEYTESQEQHIAEKRQLETTLESFQSGLLQPDAEDQADLRSKYDELEMLVESLKSSQTVLQLAVAERDEEIASLKSRDVEDDQTNLPTCLEEQKALLQEKISEDDEDVAEDLAEKSNQDEPQSEPSVEQDQSGSMVNLAGQLQSIMQELAQLKTDYEQAALEKEELQDEVERINQELDGSQRQGYEMSEALMEKEHIAKVTQAQLDAKLMTISQMRTKHTSEVETLQQTINDLKTEKERLASRSQELKAADNAAVDADVDMCDTELRALRAAFDTLRADYENVQMSTEDNLISQRNGEHQESSTDDNSLHAQYVALNDDVKTMTDNLQKLSRERDDCVDELRALEAQLMEVSEERMALTVAADEKDALLREMQEQVMSSAEKLTKLQTQLIDTQSTNTRLEESNARLEQEITKTQADSASLQADHDERPSISFNVEAGNVEEQLQARLDKETSFRERLELDVKSYEETLSVLRNNVKDDSHTIADLTEKLRAMQTELDTVTHAQEVKEKELAKMADTLAKAKEEEEELRFQRQQRMTAAETKEMALQDRIVSLEKQLQRESHGSRGINDSTQDAELLAAQEKEAELAFQVTALEIQLADARLKVRDQDEEWHRKQEMAEREFARMTAEQEQLREQIAALQSEQNVQQLEEELLKSKQLGSELLEKLQAVQHELETVNAKWEEREQELLRQMNSIREQFDESQEELDEYKKNVDGEIRRLHAVNEELRRAAEAKQEELESQVGEQEDWQNQVKSRQEALQAKCEELDDERRELHERYSALVTERSNAEEQLRDEIHELSLKCADAETKLNELENLEEELKSAQSEAAQYHNKLVEEQLAKESIEKLVDKQKARIDKLEKVKMTTDTLDLFRKLKKDRQQLQTTVQRLQKSLNEAEQERAHNEKETQRLMERKGEELHLTKERLEELREALSAEKQQANQIKTEMRAAFHDEREKTEHEIQQMQTLLKEKIDRVETLEGEMAALQEQRNEVSYLKEENLNLHVEIRQLKQQLIKPSQADKENEEPTITGTFDGSAAEAAKMLGVDAGDKKAGGDIVHLHGDDDNDSPITSPAPEQKPSPVKTGGFLLSTTELNAIAGDSQEDPKVEARPECHQQ